MIPKIIHYCWFGPKKMSRIEEKCLNSWRKKLPDYEIKLWNEKNFEINKFPFALEAYEQKKFAFVSDVARLFALYTEGGIYLDTDMLVLKNLDNFLKDPFFIGLEDSNIISAGIIGSERNNIVIKHLLDSYQYVKFDKTLKYTVPIHIALVVKNENLNGKIRFYDFDFFYSLPFDKKNEPLKKFITKNSHVVHLWNHSWHNEFMALKYFSFLVSIKLHISNVISFKKEYLKLNYFKKYYFQFYLNFKRFIKIKIVSILKYFHKT